MGWVSMRAVKKINNNVVVCVDGSGHEIVAMGRGIGFGQLPRDISFEQIERTFYDVDDRYADAMRDVPIAVLAFAARLSDIARNELCYELTPNLAFILADHCSFALERARTGLRVRMPLAYDVEQVYPHEYAIGRRATERLEREFGTSLDQDEPARIALNLVNARIGGGNVNGEADREIDEMLEEVTEIIEDELSIFVNRGTFSYSRYVTHLLYLFRRLREGKALSTDNMSLFQGLVSSYPDVAACVEKIAGHVRASWGVELSEEERSYLILHVNRIRK